MQRIAAVALAIVSCLLIFSSSSNRTLRTENTKLETELKLIKAELKTLKLKPNGAVCTSGLECLSRQCDGNLKYCVAQTCTPACGEDGICVEGNHCLYAK